MGSMMMNLQSAMFYRIFKNKGLKVAIKSRRLGTERNLAFESRSK